MNTIAIYVYQCLDADAAKNQAKDAFKEYGGTHLYKIDSYEVEALEDAYGFFEGNWRVNITYSINTNPEF